MSLVGEFKKRLASPQTELLWKRYAYTNKKPDGSFPQQQEFIRNIIDEAKKEYEGFEKEISHLLEQPRHPESEKALKYALLTLKALNEKWFGSEAPLEPK